jgi:hypothetical protein
MRTVHETRPIYASITARLETVGRPVGNGVSPGGETPYYVIYPRENLFSDGGLSDPNQILVRLFQVTSVGGDMEEAQWAQHKAQAVLLGFIPAGGSAIELDQEGPLLRDDDGPVFTIPDRYRVYVS